MKILLFITILLLGSLVASSQSHLEVGVEMGYHITGYIPQKQTTHSVPIQSIGGKIGFFIEREVTDFLNLRFNVFYNHRHFHPKHNFGSFWTPFANLHIFTFPIKAVLKAGKIVHFGIGPDPILLTGEATPTSKTQFHMGICGDVTFRIRKLMRLSFYCNYDFVGVKYPKNPKSNNIAVGVSFAIAFKKFKKRRVIYGPG